MSHVYVYIYITTTYNCVTLFRPLKIPFCRTSICGWYTALHQQYVLYCALVFFYVLNIPATQSAQEFSTANIIYDGSLFKQCVINTLSLLYITTYNSNSRDCTLW
jgi:hypothetical protein